MDCVDVENSWAPDASPDPCYAFLPPVHHARLDASKGWPSPRCGRRSATRGWHLGITSFPSFSAEADHVKSSATVCYMRALRFGFFAWRCSPEAFGRGATRWEGTGCAPTCLFEKKYMQSSPKQNLVPTEIVLKTQSVSLRKPKNKLFSDPPTVLTCMLS